MFCFPRVCLSSLLGYGLVAIDAPFEFLLPNSPMCFLRRSRLSSFLVLVYIDAWCRICTLQCTAPCCMPALRILQCCTSICAAPVSAASITQWRPSSPCYLKRSISLLGALATSARARLYGRNITRACLYLCLCFIDIKDVQWHARAHICAGNICAA